MFSITQEQQEQINSINQLLQSAAPSILCGPDCQREKRIEELKQQYLDAQNNVITSPERLKQIEKEYIEYTQGTAAYNDFLEKNLENDANQIGESLQKMFDDSVEQCKTALNSYYGVLINDVNIEELHDTYLRENDKLDKEIKKNIDSTLTNDRKAYYKDKDINTLLFYYKVYFYFYIILLIVFIISIFWVNSIYPKQIIFYFLVFFFFYMFIPLFI